MAETQMAREVIFQLSKDETKTIIDLGQTTVEPEDVPTEKQYFTRDGRLVHGTKEEQIKPTDFSAIHIYSNGTYNALDYGLGGWNLVEVKVPKAADVIRLTNATSNELRRGSGDKPYTAYSKNGFLEGTIPDYPETGDNAIIKAPFDGEDSTEEQCEVLSVTSPKGEVLYTQQHYVEKNLLVKPVLEPVDVILKANEDQTIPVPEGAAGILEVNVPGVQAYETTINATNETISQEAEINKFISKVTVEPPKSEHFIFNPATPAELEAGFDASPTNGNYYFNKATMAPVGEDKINVLKIFPDRFDNSEFEDEDGKYLQHLPENNGLWYFNEARIYNIPEKYVVLDKTEPLDITVNKNDIDVSQYYKVNVNVPLNYEDIDLTYTPNQDTQLWESYTNPSTQKNICAKKVIINPVPLYGENNEQEKKNNYLYIPEANRGLDKAQLVEPTEEYTTVEVFKNPYTHIQIKNNPLAGTSENVENHEFATSDQILRGYVAWSAEQKREGGIQTYQGVIKNIGAAENGDVTLINFSDPAGVVLDINKQYSSGDIRVIPSLAEYEIDYPMDKDGDKNIRKDQMTWTIDDLNEILGEEHVGPSSITIKLPINYQIVQDQLEINTEGEHFVGQYESVLVKLPANKPSEIASESLMDEKLRTSDPGVIFKYTGVTGKYEHDQYYIVEEFLGG